MMNRLFISLDIPEYVRDEINAIRHEVYGIGSDRIRWEDNSKLHVTLKFLGDVNEKDVSKILQKMQFAVSKFEHLSLELDKFGVFNRGSVPNILWLGLKPNQQLESLNSAIETELSKIGFRKEKRKFFPHITVLRLKGNENQAQIERFYGFQLEDAQFTSNSVSLVQSTLKPTGSVYNIIKSFYMI